MKKNWKCLLIFFPIFLIFLLQSSILNPSDEENCSIVLAHCGDYVDFTISAAHPGKEVRIVNLAKNSAYSRVRVYISTNRPQTETIDIPKGESASWMLTNANVKIRLLERGSGGRCRAEVGEADCQREVNNKPSPWDSDVRVYFPKSSSSVTTTINGYCHLGDPNVSKCSVCGASLKPWREGF